MENQTRQPYFKINVEEFLQHCRDFDGICLKCGQWTSGGCEPDAREYTCEYCGANRVFGAEEAMMMGRIKP